MVVERREKDKKMRKKGELQTWRKVKKKYPYLRSVWSLSVGPLIKKAGFVRRGRKTDEGEPASSEETQFKILGGGGEKREVGRVIRRYAESCQEDMLAKIAGG